MSLLPIKPILGAVTMTAVASTFVYLVVNTPDTSPTPEPAESESRPQSEAQPEPPDEITLCADADRVLRLPPGSSSACPPGQTKVVLKKEQDEQLCELCDPFMDSGDKEPGNPELDAIEKRLSRLENAPYFEVVDSRERPIFQVTPNGVRFLNRQQQAVGLLGTPGSGSFLKLQDPRTKMAATISASGSNTGVLIYDGSDTRLEMGMRSGGPFALRLPTAGGMVAGLGQSRAGTGALVIGNGSGLPRATFTSTDGRGMISINSPGAGGVGLLEATIGGGMFEISNSAGNSAVEMGHRLHKFGIVLAGPIFGIPYVPRTGIPGTYFVGCASGARPACVP